jgi:sugar phosphate isomerase/epimerase
MARLHASIRLFARHFPGTTLVVNTGLAPAGNFAAAHRVAIEQFGRAARLAADRGVRLALEPLHPVYMNTDTFICTLAEAERMIDAVDHPAFGVFLDVWHYGAEPDAARRVRGFGARIFGVHVSDWRRPRAFADRLLPGDGELPLPALLRGIRAAGYRGTYTLEIFSDRKLPDSLWAHPARTVRRGQANFAQLWKKTCA